MNEAITIEDLSKLKLIEASPGSSPWYIRASWGSKMQYKPIELVFRISEPGGSTEWAVKCPVKTSGSGDIKRHHEITKSKPLRTAWLRCEDSSWQQTFDGVQGKVFLPFSAVEPETLFLSPNGRPFNVPFKRRNTSLSELRIVATKGGRTQGRPGQQYALLKEGGLYRIDLSQGLVVDAAVLIRHNGKQENVVCTPNALALLSNVQIALPRDSPGFSATQAILLPVRGSPPHTQQGQHSHDNLHVRPEPTPPQTLRLQRPLQSPHSQSLMRNPLPYRLQPRQQSSFLQSASSALVVPSAASPFSPPSNLPSLPSPLVTPSTISSPISAAPPLQPIASAQPKHHTSVTHTLPVQPLVNDHSESTSWINVLLEASKILESPSVSSTGSNLHKTVRKGIRKRGFAIRDNKKRRIDGRIDQVSFPSETI